MGHTRKVNAGLAQIDSSRFIGEYGHLFYDNDSGALRRSDGMTPGGLPVIVSVTTASIGDLVITGANISTIHANEDLSLSTNGLGNVNIYGNFKVFADGVGSTVSFNALANGLITINAPDPVPSGSSGALNIIGSADGGYQTVNGTGGMIHITGNENALARITVDGYLVNSTGPQTYNGTAAGYGVLALRTARGTASNPLHVLANDTLASYSGLGYVGTGGYSVGQVAGLQFFAAEDFTTSNDLGTYAQLRLTPIGSKTSQVAIQFNATGIDFITTGTGITFSDDTIQTTAWTGTIVSNQVIDLATHAVTGISLGTGLSGSGNPGVASINNTGVLSITGTPNQILINNNGQNITVTTPQNLNTTATVTFQNITVTGNLNVSGTATIATNASIVGKILYLASSATSAAQTDGGGIQLGTGTFSQSILYNLTNNYWDTNGAGINTQQLIADATTIDSLIVNGRANFGESQNITLYPNALIQGDANTNTYAQLIIQNHSTGTNASTDVIATNDAGDDENHYIDLGINSSVYNTSTWGVNGVNDGYLYVNQGGVAIGTDTPTKTIVFFTDGTLAGNIRATINTQGLQVVNTITAASFVGTLTGTATKLHTPVTINNVNFDGSANINIANTQTLTIGIGLTGNNYNGSSSSIITLNTTTLMSNAVTAQNVVNAVTHLTGSTYIGVSTSTGSVSLTNLGVQTLIGGYGVGVSNSTGTVTVNSLFASTATSTTTYTLDFTNSPDVIVLTPGNNPTSINMINYISGRIVNVIINGTQGSAVTINNFGATTPNVFNGTNSFKLNTPSGMMRAEFYCTGVTTSSVYVAVNGGK